LSRDHIKTQSPLAAQATNTSADFQASAGYLDHNPRPNAPIAARGTRVPGAK
jgi:hypothetical protein